MDEIRTRNKRVLRCKMVYARKYESVVCDDGQIRDRFLKWKGRLAAVGTGEVKSLDTCWSTFSPTIGMTAMRTLIALKVPQRIRCAELRFVRCIFGHGLSSGSVCQVARRSSAGKYAGKIVRCEGIVRIDHFFPGFRESAVGGDTRFRGKRWQVQALR
jgi:hypothetical protein